jgi:hypothetical protein
MSKTSPERPTTGEAEYVPRRIHSEQEKPHPAWENQSQEEFQESNWVEDGLGGKIGIVSGSKRGGRGLTGDQRGKEWIDA